MPVSSSENHMIMHHLYKASIAFIVLIINTDAAAHTQYPVLDLHIQHVPLSEILYILPSHFDK